MFPENYQVVPIQTSDYKLVSDFINTCGFYFRHLDWRLPVDWLGTQPYLLCTSFDRPVAMLVCPYIHEEHVWLRFFAGQAFHSTQLAWGLLLDQCSVELRKNGAKAIYSIALQDWYRDLLEASGFLLDTRIVVLEKPLNSKMDGGTIPAGYQLVRMQPMELNEVWDLDKSSFSPLWQMSHEDILTAFHVSENCTVIRNDNGELIGYQISNSLPTGGHLARIAVKPSEQGKGLGKILLADLTNRFVDMGTQRITVNTQEDNSTALGLYERNGFIRTGETYPVFRMDL